MTAGFQRLTPDILVNTTTYFGQFDSKITLLTNGNIVVTWTQFDPDDEHWDVRAQIFTSIGEKLGSEISVTSDLYDQERQSITALANGNFVVTWADNALHEGSPFIKDIRAQIYSPSGQAIGTPLTISLPNFHLATFPEITTLSNGNFVVAWSDQTVVPSSAVTYFAVFQPDGTPVGTPAQFEPSATMTTWPMVKNLSNGQFIVMASTMTAADIGLYAQIYNADGSVSGSDFRINIGPTTGIREPHVTQLTDGKIVVVWYTYDAGTFAVRGQIIDLSGNKIGGEFLVASNAVYMDDPDVTALADGRFIVTWSDWSGTLGDANNAGVHAQIYLANGEKSGVEFLINVNTLNAQSNARIVAMSDGRFAVTYTDDSALPGPLSGSDIRLQIFDPTHYELSAGGESYTGGNLDDTIIGSENADVIDGNGGNDIINAGGGADTIVFRAGLLASNVNGGDGTDILLVIDGTLPTGFDLNAAAIEQASWVQNDLANNQAWSKIVSSYNSSWAITESLTTYDDGRKRDVLYDLSGQYWSTLFQDFNAAGQRTAFQYNYDDGRIAHTTIDLTGAATYWSSLEQRFNSAGQRTEYQYNYDDGRIAHTTIDLTGAATYWSTLEQRFNAAGQRTEYQYNWDDGRISHTLEDRAGLYWASLTQNFRTDGTRTDYTYVFDNNIKQTVIFDVDNAYTWNTATYNYDALGNLINIVYA